METSSGGLLSVNVFGFIRSVVRQVAVLSRKRRDMRVSQNFVTPTPTVKPTAPRGVSNGLFFEEPCKRWGGGRMTAVTACRRCGTEPLDNARFCQSCGSPVDDADTRAEYKQVTVLFADVVHSMDIASAVGAEQLREIMTGLVDRSAVVVQRYGGTVDNFTGHGIMAVFGALGFGDFHVGKRAQDPVHGHHSIRTPWRSWRSRWSSWALRKRSLRCSTSRTARCWAVIRVRRNTGGAGIVALLGFPTLWRRRRRKRQGLATHAKGVVDYSCGAPRASLIFSMTAAPGTAAAARR